MATGETLGKRLVFVALVALALASSASADDFRATVYVAVERGLAESAPSGKRKQVSDTVNDVKAQIAKRSRIVVTSERSMADITVYILDRGINVRTIGQTNWGGALTQNQYLSRYIIVYRLKAAEFDYESEVYAEGALVTWKRLASDLSKKVERFAVEHEDRLAELSEQRDRN